MNIKKIIKIGTIIFIVLYIILPFTLYIIFSYPYKTAEQRQLKPMIKASFKGVANMFIISSVDITEEYNRVDIHVKFTAGTVYDYTIQNAICMNKVTKQMIDYLNTIDDIPKYENINLQFKYSNRNNAVNCLIYLLEGNYILADVCAKYVGSISNLYVMEDAYKIGVYYYPVDQISKEEVKNFQAMKNLEQIYFSTNSYNNDMQQFADWVHEFMPECEVRCKDGIVGSNGIIE